MIVEIKSIEDGRLLLNVEDVTEVLEGVGGVVVFATKTGSVLYTPCPRQYVVITK